MKGQRPPLSGHTLVSVGSALHSHGCSLGRHKLPYYCTKYLMYKLMQVLNDITFFQRAVLFLKSEKHSFVVPS